MSQQYPNGPQQPFHPNQPPMQPGQPPLPPKKKHTLRNVLLIGAGVFVLLAGGCTAIVASIGDAANDASKQTSGSAPATPVDNGPTPDPITTPTNTPPAVEETTPPPAEPSVAKVGATQWFTYENGLEVQATKVARFKIGPYAAGGTPGGSGVVVTVTIKNGSKETADLSLTTVKLAYGANGDQAEQVYDENYGSGFEGSATPGKSKTAKFAFAVPKGRQLLDIEVEPGFLDYESVHFEGTVK